ncbi:MAG: hypothetical protein M3P95_05535, partial [Actinomycetota bacterium]|nr:hypothetical protein [Actinomycetota bacterium]
APVGLTGLAVPASTGSTDSAPLACGPAGVFEVTGFGRGQVLHLVGGTQQFVVTFAQRQLSGQVVFDNPGLAAAPDLLTCQATSPVSGQVFTFRGFLTPRS